jgi:hypothetical protein
MLLESGFTEAGLGKGDFGQARASAERLLETTADFGAYLAGAGMDAIARVAMSQHDSQRAHVCITNALTAMEAMKFRWLNVACMVLHSMRSAHRRC